MRMCGSRPTAAWLFAAALLCAQPAGAQAAPTTGELLDRAADLAYNLDHDEAIAVLREAIRHDPENPAAHRALASTLWLNILFQRGAVTVDHYLGGFTKSQVSLKQPPAALDAEFKREVARAISLSERRVAAAPRDPQAHYDLGAAYGLEATYTASVEGKLLAGFRAARRAYDEHERVLDLDSRRTDAGLVIGTYRYIVSTLSLPVRLLAYIVGFGGGRERGIRMVEEAAAGSGENRTEARFALVLLYNREKRFADASRALEELRQRYPRNRLVVLEAGATASRDGRAADAEALLTTGLEMFARDPRPKMPGEAALWHYKRGAARVMLKREADATADLRLALTGDAAAWVQGRAHLELARLALARGDRATAQREVSQAVALCQHDDDVCVSEAKKLVK